MKKPDLSKSAIQAFFLYHSEKLILAAAVVLLGVFFWMGFKSKPFSEKTPDELAKMADRAEQYIRSGASWDSIKDFRKGSKEVADVVRDDGGVDPALYKIDPITGIVARTLDPRTDPVVLGVSDVEATMFTAPLIVALSRPLIQDPFSEFPSAAGLGPEPADPASGFNAGGFGAGGFGAGDDDEDYDDDDEDEDDFEDGDMAGGFGGKGGAPGGFGSTAEEDDTRPVIDGIGTQLQLVNQHTFPGIRPTVLNIPTSSSKSFIYDVVVVTGLVDIQKQWSDYESSFATGVGFYPDRDKPIYQFLQVERREVSKPGEPVAGEAGQWSDHSELISFQIPSRFPNMHRLPKAFYPSAPDIVAPVNYDPILTGPIPPVVMFDYLPYVNHSKLMNSNRAFPDPVAEEVLKDVGANDVFTTGGGNQGGFGFGGGGGAAGKFSGGGGGGMGMAAGGPGAPGGAPGGMGGRGGMGGAGMGGAGKGGAGMGGAGMGGAGMGGAGMGGTGGFAVEILQTRRGTDFTDHIKALDAKTSKSQYRLVRFFDVLINTKLNATYEYRMRLWIGDPNNEDLTQEFASRQGGVPVMTGGFDSGMDDEEDDEEEDEEDDEEYGYDPNAGRGLASGNQNGGEPVAKYVAITGPMKHPDVRKRLNRARQERNPKTGEVTYFVSEVTGQDADGKNIIEEVKVPKVGVGFTETGETIYSDYLRFARPSPWSDPVAVYARTQNSQVAGGQVEPSKKARVKINNEDIEIPISEPKAELAASVWWKKDLGTALPTKQTVYRGDALDFITPSYFLHPVTWQVQVAKNDISMEDETQYLVPIETGKVIVDAIAGEELALPRTEKMRHNLASEVLVMDEFGNFSVRNDMVDSTAFRNMLFLADESQIVGKPKIRKKSRDDPAGGAGKFSGGGGRDDDEDF